jgi:transcriptional regulator of arginine metabolism
MKAARHEKIKELIRNHHIDTQEELAGRLREAGFSVTQATVSRDIRELKVTKVTDNDGRSRYAIIDSGPEQTGDSQTRVIRQAVTSVKSGQNLVVIRTAPGMAMGVAAALDSLKWEELLGCIAGDDTIFCAAQSNDQAFSVAERIRLML